MERLTWQNYDMCQFCGEGACCERYCDNTFPVCDDKAIYDRLAAYEDTGLEPCDYSAMAHALKQAERAREDLTEMIRQIGATGLDRLRELAQADREGRCVVLPCKVGDTVYQVDDIRVYALEVRNLIYDAGILAFDESTIGKTVFLTRAEAEAAISERG